LSCDICCCDPKTPIPRCLSLIEASISIANYKHQN
jgi:hypothetical protein